MQLSNAPGKLVLPFANAGGKNVIPVASQIGITPGAASFTDGFPPLTRTPIASGGTPPSGLDMNGIMFDVSAITQWANAGAGYVWDSSFATNTNVLGYPQGSQVLRSDGTGYWLNLTDNNQVSPEASASAAVAAGWVPGLTNGVTSIAMTNANVTLTPLQYGKPIIIITGTLTANLNLVFPNIAGEWTIINSTTGAFTINAKTTSGTGQMLVRGTSVAVCDGANNIYFIGGTVLAGLIFLTTNTTFFVSTTGNDTTGNGTSGSPWATVSHAAMVIANNYYLAGFTATIQLQDTGSTTVYTVTGNITPSNSGPIVVQGNVGNPTRVQVHVASGNCFNIVGSGYPVTVSSVEMETTTSGFGISANFSQVNLTALTFGACAQGYINASGPGTYVTATDNNTVFAGNTATGINTFQQGQFNGGGRTFTFTGTPTWGNAFTFATGGAMQYWAGATLTGSATGVRYISNDASIIQTSGGGANFFPGNSAGTTSQGFYS